MIKSWKNTKRVQTLNWKTQTQTTLNHAIASNIFFVSKLLLAAIPQKTCATNQHWLQLRMDFLFQGRHTALQVADPHNIFCACQHAVQILTCPKPLRVDIGVKIKNIKTPSICHCHENQKQPMKASDFLAKTVYRQLPPMPKQLRIRLRNLPLLLPPQQFLYRPLRSLS